MQKPDPFIRTKLHVPFTRQELVTRPRLQARIAEGLRGPLTLITAPAGFGKTTLVAASMAGSQMQVAWLSLDQGDNQVERFLVYLLAAFQGVNPRIGSQATQLMAGMQQSPPEVVLSSLINDLDSASTEIALVLDDYQVIKSQAVHEGVAFLLEHCPLTLHLLIATRSDPPLPLSRMLARGQMVELRATDLRFSEPEAAQFLNDVMGLRLDDGSVAALAERTEGWIAGLQMASIALQAHLSGRDREDAAGFIAGFSGTNRYILDYLVEEVLACQPPEIQRFLLHTSILERLTAPLCDAILKDRGGKSKAKGRRDGSSALQTSSHILEYLDRANLFLVPLDDERSWYRYHHLFAELLRTQLQKSIGTQGMAQLHLRSAQWHEQNGSILEAIHHASIASDNELVERLIEQHYMDMVNRGEMSWVRSWMGKLSTELIYRRPWLCLYKALSHSWFGQLEEAEILLNEAEKRIQSEPSAPGVRSMLGYHAYVKSRVTAMRGDTRQAIQFCRTARQKIPADNLALQNETSITLGFEYFLYGDFVRASQTLRETIRSGYIARAVNNPVAAYALLARMRVYQGRLYEAEDFLQKAVRLIQETGGQYLGATGLIEVGIAALLCEWNDTDAALVRVKRSLDFLPLWGKTDDLCLAYIVLSRIQFAQGNRSEAAGAIEKAIQLVQTCGVFSEARSAVDAAQVRLWLADGDWPAVDRWAASSAEQAGSDSRSEFENELGRITQARVLMARNKAAEAAALLQKLEKAALSAGRLGRAIEIMLLRSLAKQEAGDREAAFLALQECLALAEPEGYVRVFLDEGQPVGRLLAWWRFRAGAGPLRDYAGQLLAGLDDAAPAAEAKREKATPAGMAEPGSILVEPLSRREIEVLQLMAQGMTNQEIARQLVISPGTVKAHTASIYRKLDAANRTEAAARARLLGIIS